jgi:hypothetical protein
MCASATELAAAAALLAASLLAYFAVAFSRGRCSHLCTREGAV